MSKLLIIVTAFLSIHLIGCQTTRQFKSEWTMQDKMSRFSKQTHHWGQKGEAIPNNGWSEYGYLKVGLGGPDLMLLNQFNGELVAEIYALDSDKPKLRAVSVPGVGLFYYPKQSNSCRPDAIEQIGVYSEMALFYLSKLLPQGPHAIVKGGVYKAKGPAVELRFMQAVARIKKPWEAEGTIEIIGDSLYKIQINKQDQTKMFDIEWSKQMKEVISSSEPLSNWATCWSGINTTDKDGNHSFKTNIPNTGSFSTFGDIRKFRNKIL